MTFIVLTVWARMMKHIVLLFTWYQNFMSVCPGNYWPESCATLDPQKLEILEMLEIHLDTGTLRQQNKPSHRWHKHWMFACFFLKQGLLSEDIPTECHTKGIGVSHTFSNQRKHFLSHLIDNSLTTVCHELPWYMNPDHLEEQMLIVCDINKGLKLLTNNKCPSQVIRAMFYEVKYSIYTYVK